MLEVLNEDYIRTARAKGLSNRVVLMRHALRNAAVPILTVIGLIDQHSDSFMSYLNHTTRYSKVLDVVTVLLRGYGDNTVFCHSNKWLVTWENRNLSINRRDGRRIYLLIELDARQGNQLKLHYLSFFFESLASLASWSLKDP